jgi:putative spermidine/putrescine transport system substrate-binding protein
MSTKKLLSFTLGAAAILASTSFNAQARDLTVVGWGGASQVVHHDVYFAPFSEKTGTKIVEDSYNGGLAKIKAMVDTNSVTWDAILVEAPDLLRGCENGLFETIAWDKIGPKSDYIDAAVSDCGVGSYVWAVALAYDGDALKEGPKNWADFWDVKKFPGKRGMRKGAKFNLEIALMADGVAPQDVYKELATKEGQDRAFAKLDQLKANIQWWEAGAQPPEWLASGDVVMTTAYNGRITNANKEGKNFKISWDGQVYAVDSWAVVKGSSNKDKAMEFVGFASAEENQVKFPAGIPYGVTNTKAIAAIPAALSSDLPTNEANLKNALANDTEFWIDFEGELNERFNSWAAK